IDIHRLDQVPNEELDKFADWGFSGLWLIGLWQRSPASRRIKQMTGNPEAVSSAYSLYDYVIADDLGGEEAYQDLKSRAWQRGIHLAADMVPNHVGIYSKWLIEQPDWFISLDYKPFPAYSYNGPDLSEDQRVGIYLEDHYYNRTDAAVTFKRVDRWTGDDKFIYHGNDGTSMPWNDTAQLNFLNPQAREAVIQTILHVARKFSIIRFDAAMTLSKKHYQRLWFPEPGTGGAIPTRSEHGLTKKQFNQAMPIEFWREVVDRVAEEVPNTLLLAEAFWLMEGYFVRTLGMHRVYNSAFMNMLRDEKNQDYRLVIKNTLEFDPQILKRYVNFMNNPDEDTAVAQFGKDDKYFGVCILMVTMPGLPMFGHGQVEGLHEKYGMEYRKAYWDEKPDTYLVERHQREIFPLLHRRHLFAEVKDFLLYDFFNVDGSINEDVFAYSNRQGEERSLVVFHNKWAEAHGWIKTSVAYLNKKDEQLHQISLGVGLGFQNDSSHFVIFRDHISGLEYIRNNNQLFEQGLYIELGAYKYHVFLDFREVVDNQWHQYAQLESYLDGRGVPDIQEAMKEIFLKPIHYPYRDLINTNVFLRLLENLTERHFKDREPRREKLLSELEEKFSRVLKEIKQFTGGDGNVATLTQEVRRKLVTIIDLPVLEQSQFIPPSFSPQNLIINSLIQSQQTNGEVEIKERRDWFILYAWLFTHNIGKIITEGDLTERSRSWIDEWLLGKITLQVFRELGLSEGEASYALATIKILISHQDWFREQKHAESNTYAIMQNWLRDAEVQRYLGLNRYQGLLWYNQETYQQFLRWMMTIAVIETMANERLVEEKQADSISALIRIFDKLDKAEEASEYQIEKLLDALKN
ncbi:MAG: alpha-amylase family glycosyl hydrolase, partial [Anaerolineales bacterium]